MQKRNLRNFIFTGKNILSKLVFIISNIYLIDGHIKNKANPL